MSILRLTRTRFLFLFGVCLLLAYWRASTQTAPEGPSDLQRYSMAIGPLRELLDKSGDLFSGAEKQTLREAVQQIMARFTLPSEVRENPDTLKSIRLGCELAMGRIVAVLEGSAAVERFWLGKGETASAPSIRRRWSLGSGLILLRLGRTGPETDIVPEFVLSFIDLASTRAPVVRLDDARTIYLVLSFENAGPGTTTVPVSLMSGRGKLAEVPVTIEVPRAGHLKVTIRDESGKPTPAVCGLYAENHRLVAPPEALSFDGAGFSYRPGRVRPYQSMRYWPGSDAERQVFFTDGAFSLAVPAGSYKLIIGKGFEYTPAIQTVHVGAGEDVARNVTIKRWIDMPTRGWYSGDGHVHYARSGEESNRRLLLWAQAEDVHLINVMRMGDALKTYFEQYAFGKAGRKVSGDYALVPGQEDPRTSVIGHTLQMNLQSPIRRPDQYYLYDLIFDETHRQGGLTGYAHMYQPPGRGFWVREDMSMNVPQKRIDFVELAQDGEIDGNLYYEFLNLGFKLAASGGSDVPWGNTIGSSRVYAYLGKHFDPDAWFSAVKAGRTFVTTGPMLELTVNGQVAGADIQVQPGETVRIRATAWGYNVEPRFVEVVAQGDVVKSARQASAREPVSLEFALPVRHSTWIAARCAGALTSPVYIHVGNEFFWKLKAVPELIQARLSQLHDLEALTKEGVPLGSEGGWNNPEGFQKQVSQLLERVEASRKIYLEMLAKAKSELNTDEASSH